MNSIKRIFGCKRRRGETEEPTTKRRRCDKEEDEKVWDDETESEQAPTATKDKLPKDASAEPSSAETHGDIAEDSTPTSGETHDGRPESAEAYAPAEVQEELPAEAPAEAAKAPASPDARSAGAVVSEAPAEVDAPADVAEAPAAFDAPSIDLAEAPAFETCPVEIQSPARSLASTIPPSAIEVTSPAEKVPAPVNVASIEADEPSFEMYSENVAAAAADAQASFGMYSEEVADDAAADEVLPIKEAHVPHVYPAEVEEGFAEGLAEPDMEYKILEEQSRDAPVSGPTHDSVALDGAERQEVRSVETSGPNGGWDTGCGDLEGEMFPQYEEGGSYRYGTEGTHMPDPNNNCDWNWSSADMTVAEGMELAYDGEAAVDESGGAVSRDEFAGIEGGGC